MRKTVNTSDWRCFFESVFLARAEGNYKSRRRAVSKMPLTLPNSMDECVYFTNRSLLDESGKPAGKAICWVPRVHCLKCKTGWMGKPHDAKTGKVKVRSTEYVCSKCGVVEEKEEHEARLLAHAQYTCPACNKTGEGTVSYARKTYQGCLLYTSPSPRD